jgi:hypothetical protein
VGPTTQDDRSYSVPDFEADDAVRKRYNSVARELIAAAIARGLAEVRETFDRLNKELGDAAKDAETAQRLAENAAHLARAKYAKIVPRQRTASGIVRPPTVFFDLIQSMGAAEKFYNEAIATQQTKRETTEAARAAFAAVERLKSKFDAALVLRELEIRRHYKTDEGRNELDADPRLHGIAVQCAAIEAERADFRARQAAGAVGDDELRDRTMAQEGSRYLDGDVRGLHCLRERDVRFGKLRYFTFRDRDGRIWLLDYSDDLRLLMTVTFDVTHTNGRYIVGRSASDGTHHRDRLHARLTGPDPRAGLGVDPALMRAIVDFVARERTTL